MVQNNKILTVSYGTFSCTLEGFEDSFGTMTAIAEYFRDLAADDRYFGAEPPQPDAEMLAHIAQREISRRVDVQQSPKGITLRAHEDATPATPTAIEPSPAPIADIPTPVAQDPAPEDHPIPAAVRAAEQIESPDLAPEGALAAQDAPAIPADDGVATAELMPIPAAGAGGSIADKLQRIRAVVSRNEGTIANSAYSEDEHAESFISDTANDISMAMEEDDASMLDEAPIENDISDALDRLDAGDMSLIDDGAEEDISSADDAANQDIMTPTEPDSAETAEVVEDLTDDLQELAEESDVEADGADEDVADIPHVPEDLLVSPETTSDGDVSDMMAAIAEAAPLNDAEATEEPASQEQAEDDAELMAHLAELGEDDLEADQEDDTALFGDLDAHDDEDVDLEELNNILDDDGEDVPRVIKVTNSDLDDDDDFDADAAELPEEDSPLSPEAEAELMRELELVQAEAEAEAQDQEETAEHPDITELEQELATVLSDEPDQAEAEAEAEATEEDSDNKQGVYVLRHESDEVDEDMSRLMAAAEEKMEEPESSTSRDTYEHLRAAVAAAEAEKSAGNDITGDDSDNAYREDLASVVRPRRPVSKGAKRRPNTDARPAPLKLVAEQRIDIDAAQATKGPVRPRRVATAMLEDDESGKQDASGTFKEFAEEMGATELPELLEAAAAYMSFVEGRNQFSRPQLMNKVRQIETSNFNREDGLRSFGRLLREGKIEKTEGGRFTASGDIGFRPDERAAG